MKNVVMKKNVSLERKQKATPMKKSFFLLLGMLPFCAACHHTAPAELAPTSESAPGPIVFDEYFLDKSMRLDFYHCGNAHDEMFFFDELREEPYWGGSLVSLLDTFNLGDQRFVLLDKATRRVIYSYHYSTLWCEWKYTEEAQTTSKGMPESVVFPYPKGDVIAQIWSRQPAKECTEAHQPWILKYEQEIKADDKFVRGFSSLYETEDLHVVADPHHALDIVIVPEGYNESERDVFETDCQFFLSEFFGIEPWRSNEQRVNVRLVWAPSAESGVSIPFADKWCNTAVKANYCTFGSDRYQMTQDYQLVCDIAGHVPYDEIYILTNSDKYGGGGIYNFYGIGAGHDRAGSSGRVHIHEFGHEFAYLGDEYVEVGNSTSDAYAPHIEPCEANLTTKVDISGKPWVTTPPIPGTDVTPDSIYGKWLPEGGGYLEKGIWHPYENCMMRILAAPFCPVCLQAQIDVLDRLCR